MKLVWVLALALVASSASAQRAPEASALSERAWLGLGALSLGGALTAGAYTTPESTHGIALGRVALTTAGTLPSLHFARESIGHEGIEKLNALPLLFFSPLAAGSGAALSRVANDGSNHRVRGFLLAWAASLLVDWTMVPLFKRLRSEPRRTAALLFSTAITGFVTSTIYNVSAGLPSE